MNEININALTHAKKIVALIRFMRENELIEELGWYEHTSDWDPSVLVTLKSGVTIESSMGYSEVSIVGYKRDKTIELDADKLQSIEIYVDKADEEDFEPDVYRIAIEDIESLRWIAN